MKNGLASSREKLCECSRPTPRRAIAEKMGSRVRGEESRGIRKPWPRLRCLDLAWLCTLHTVRIQTDLRGFARQKVREREEGEGDRKRGREENPGFTLVMRTGREEERGITSSGKSKSWWLFDVTALATLPF